MKYARFARTTSSHASSFESAASTSRVHEVTAAVASGQLSIAAELVSHGAPFAGEAAGLKAAAAEGRVGELQRLLDAGVPADYAEVGAAMIRTYAS